MREVWYIYQNVNMNNARAIFFDEASANNYAATNNEYQVVKAEIEVPFNAFPSTPINPA